MAKRAIDGERIGLDVGLEALRQDRLVDVSGGDPFLDRPHAASKTSFVWLARMSSSARSSGSGCDKPALELAFEKLDLGARELVERAQILVSGDAGVGDDQNPMLHVIEGQHGVEQHETGIVFRGGAGVVGAGPVAFAHAFLSAGSKIGEAS